MASVVRSRPVTQAEVARMAGCSQNTVALALRDSSRISPERREHIQKLAIKLGYRPNVAARNLVRQRSGLIGLFTGSLDSVRNLMVSQLLTELHSTEYRPILGVDESRPSPWYRAPWIESFLDFRVEAMVPIAWTDAVQLPDWYREIPLIMSAIQPDSTLPCDFVGLDRMDAGRQATEYLLRKGHHRIAVLANIQNRFFVQGYAATMRDAGLATEFVAFDGRPQQVEEFIRRARSTQADRPTAVVVLNSMGALCLLDALQAAGIRVPEDVAIVGYDRLPMAEHLRLPMTTIEQPVKEVAAQTIELTRKRLAQLDASPMHVVVKHELVVRASA